MSMENWGTGLLILKQLLSSATNGNGASERDVRNIVREELQKSHSDEQTEILKDLIQALEEKEKKEEEKKLKERVEELSQKLEKLDREKKVTENRAWMMDLIDKMTVAGAPRDYQQKAGRGGRGGGGRGAFRGHSYQQKAERGGRGGGGRGAFRGHRQSIDARNTEDHLPWTDGPKRISDTNQDIKTNESFVVVKHEDCSLNSYEKQQGRGRGGFHFHRSASHGPPHHGGGRAQYHGRGNHSNRGRGAIPKSGGAGRPTGNKPEEQGTGNIQHLTNKLQHLSTADVQVSLSPAEIIAIKNALKEKNVAGNQQKPKPKQQEEKKKKQHSTQKKQNDGGPAKPSGQVVNAQPTQTPSLLYAVDGYDDSFLNQLPGNYILEDAVVLIREGDRVATRQPRTIQELKNLKSKHPSAELFALKPNEHK